MKVGDYFTAHSIVSHTIVALVAAAACWIWFGTQKELAMKQETKKFKIALFKSENVFYHQKSADGFLESFESLKTGSTEICDYTVSSFDPIIIRQVGHALLDDNPDVIVSFGATLSQSVISLVRAKEIKTPIVFVGVSQPVELGFVKSLTSSGNNVTGTATMNEKTTDPFDLLRYLKPDLKSILLPYCSSVMGGRSADAIEQVQSYFKRYNIEVYPLPVESIGNVLKLVAGLISKCDTLMYLEGDMVGDAHTGLARLCQKHRKTFFPLELEAMEGGAALAYGVWPAFTGKVAAQYVGKILYDKVHPSDLPVAFLEDSRKLMINKDHISEQGLNLDPLLIKFLEKSTLYKNDNNEKKISSSVGSGCEFRVS